MPNGFAILRRVILFLCCSSICSMLPNLCQLPPIPALCCPVVALSGLPAVLSGGVWVCLGGSDISPGAVLTCYGTVWLATTILGQFSPVMALFVPAVTLNKLTPTYLALSGPAVALPSLPLPSATALIESPDSLICHTSPHFCSTAPQPVPFLPFRIQFFFFIKLVK